MPFIFFGSIFAVFAVIIRFIIPQEVDSERCDTETALGFMAEESTNPLLPLSFWQLMCKPKIFFGCFSSCLAYFVYSQQEPILAQRFKEYGVTNDSMGHYFAILPIFYMLSGIIMQWYPKWVDNRVYLIIIGYVNTFGALCNGPSSLLHFPDSIWTIVFGQILLGLTCAQLNVFALPEMMR